MRGSRLVALYVLIGSACAVHGQTGATSRAIFSTSRRFVVHGLPRPEAAVVAAWADDVANRLERFVGAGLPALPGPAIDIRSGASESTEEHVVTRAQGYAGEGLIQKLLVDDIAAADQEDLLEGLCWLLVNRYLIARQSHAARASGLAVAPDWLAMGVAQNLYPAQRERNAALTLARWRDGSAFMPRDVMALGYLPQGRWIEKAWCGQFVAWVLEGPGAAKRWPALVERIDPKGGMAEEALGDVLGHASPKELARAWDVWLGAQGASVLAHPADEAARLEELRKLMVVEPELYGAAATSGAPASVSMQDLLQHRDEPWMPGLAGRLSFKIQWLAMGQSPEFQEVARRYVVYLDGLVGRRAPGASGVFGGKPSDRKLRRWLAETDAARVRQEELAARRRGYVDRVEAGVKGAAEDPARRKYVDEAERRLAR